MSITLRSYPQCISSMAASFEKIATAVVFIKFLMQQQGGGGQWLAATLLTHTLHSSMRLATVRRFSKRCGFVYLRTVGIAEGAKLE